MKNNTVTRLLAYVGKSKKTLLFVFVTVLVGNVSLLLAPRYIGDAVDLLAEGGDGWERAFVTLLALIAGLYAVGSFLQWLSARAGKLVAARPTPSGGTRSPSWGACRSPFSIRISTATSSIR